ncbi:hypothetical protein Tco_0934071 [Tanacetum coccineum]
MARHGSRHLHLCQQVRYVFKDEERLSKAIRLTGTKKNTPLKLGKHRPGFYHKTTKENKRYDMIWKVSPWKGVIHFGKQGKLNPKNIGPFKNLAKVGIVAYRLELLQQLSKVHSTLHLKECWSNETLVIPLDEIQIDDKLYFIEETVKIIDRDVRHLNQSRIPTVKVRWNSKRGPESTWEREDQL